LYVITLLILLLHIYLSTHLSNYLTNNDIFVDDNSIDIITSAMVLHHVKHVPAVLNEMRRVITLKGVLVIREHHCTSSFMGAFLDITHGLYSLAWSSPVEWPAFLDEYQAW
jgi:2-polyprenyl-3-methyl-5-hydroxy-6-metoxy-1,4-benzoquinol methylase